jgi:hypothetical protein
MRDYGKVHTSFWTSQTTRLMSEDARSMAMYLLTSPHGTISGAFRLPDGYVCDDLQWSSERVSATLIELLNKGFANRCETTKWVWINKHFEWNKPENPNQFKSASKIALSIPDECCWKSEYMRLNAYFLGIEYQPFVNPSETLPQPVTVTVTEAVTEAVTVIVPSAEESAEPKSETELQIACRQTWKFYSDAYFARYNTEAVRNAKVSGQVKNFVKRIGYSESPMVAAFYLGNNTQYYVQRGHSVDCLLADAEKLRMEWATGNVMTNTRANQIDKSQANQSAVGEAMKLLGATA